MSTVCITQLTISGVIMSCRFRVTCNKIISHKMFDHVVLIIIFLNCITIAMERPRIDPSSAVSNVTSRTQARNHVFQNNICWRHEWSGNWDECCMLIFNLKKILFIINFLYSFCRSGILNYLNNTQKQLRVNLNKCYKVWSHAPSCSSVSRVCSFIFLFFLLYHFIILWEKCHRLHCADCWFNYLRPNGNPWISIKVNI